MGHPIIVDVERSGFAESEHLVDVAVVSAEGALVASAGDPNRLAAFRSSAKPILARVCLESGWAPDEPSLAIACASHNGEPAHLAQVRKVLAAAGLGEEDLLCPPDVPGHPDPALKATTRSPIYHYCSGKHASMLSTCAVNGWAPDSYRAPDHPLQKRMTARMVALLGDDSQMLVDGCGVPTFTARLAALAVAFTTVDDGGSEAKAMRAQPFLVAGTDQLDTDLMTVAPDVLIKSGAEGLVCATVDGMGIALKSRDGAPSRGRGPATLLVLRALGLIDDDQIARLAVHAEPPILGGDETVGRVRARGALDLTSRQQMLPATNSVHAD